MHVFAAALSRLEGVLNEYGTPEAVEREWLKIAAQIGAAPLFVPADKLIDSLRALVASASYNPKKIRLGDIKLCVHNGEVAARLKSTYTPLQFNELFEFCSGNGVFSINVDEKTGLVETSSVEENWEMSGRRWVTDTVRCGDIEKVIKPSAWCKALLTLADFYSQKEEIAAIEHAVQDPNFYRLGGLTDGVAHIFIPETLKRDKSWFNNKRLESHALALSAFCQSIGDIDSETGTIALAQQDIAERESMISLLADEGTRAKIATVISNLAVYLKVINTNPKTGVFDFAAPSAGPWEEVPFADGLTWDTAATLAAFVDLRALLFAYDPTASELLKLIRSAIINTKYGAWLKNKTTLDELVERAHEKLVYRLFGSEEPIEHPLRPFDSSSAFISTSAIKLADTAVEDAALHCRLLDSLERHLLRENGMIRYAPFSLPIGKGKEELVFDSYLADNYWLAAPLRAVVTGQKQSSGQEFGSQDCSATAAYVERVKQCRPHSEAQWCWVSVMAEGYARQAVKIFTASRGHTLNADEQRMADKALRKATEFINRSYARITGAAPESACKANGKKCRGFSVPEAYEHVGSIGKPVDSEVLPGVNTPLAWGTASLFSASRWFMDALKLADQQALFNTDSFAKLI